jgi:chromosome segregation ATPase
MVGKYTDQKIEDLQKRVKDLEERIAQMDREIRTAFDEVFGRLNALEAPNDPK